MFGKNTDNHIKNKYVRNKIFFLEMKIALIKVIECLTYFEMPNIIKVGHYIFIFIKWGHGLSY